MKHHFTFLLALLMAFPACEKDPATPKPGPYRQDEGRITITAEFHSYPVSESELLPCVSANQDNVKVATQYSIEGYCNHLGIIDEQNSSLNFSSCEIEKDNQLVIGGEGILAGENGDQIRYFIRARILPEVLNEDLPQFSGDIIINGGTGKFEKCSGLMGINGTFDKASGIAYWSANGYFKVIPGS